MNDLLFYLAKNFIGCLELMQHHICIERKLLLQRFKRKHMNISMLELQGRKKRQSFTKPQAITQYTDYSKNSTNLLELLCRLVGSRPNNNYYFYY